MKHFPSTISSSVTIMISLSFLVISQTENLTAVKGDLLSPNTDINGSGCSVEKWGPNDPYGMLVAVTIGKLALDGASQPDYAYYLHYTDGDKAAYGFSGCSADLSQQDCTACLARAGEYLISTCYFSISAEVTISDDCIMLYGDSPFYG